MPIIKAAIKHLRQSEKRRAINRARKEKFKKEMKEMIKLAKAKDTAEFKKKLPAMMSLLDKAAKHHLLHRNNAAHKKSRLAHLLVGKPTVSPL